MQSTAIAHPNIALVKYWGKQAGEHNRPAVPSLSITLDALWTRTHVCFDASLASDALSLNGNPDSKALARASACLSHFRELSGIRDFARVETLNNFPTGAGLASSASGFAALTVAADQALGLGLETLELSRIARRHSGSAARSLYGGFVEMPLDDRDEAAYSLAPVKHWALETVVAVTSTGHKPVGSTEGMTRTAETSAFYPSWLGSAEQDFSDAREAVLRRDFDRLAQVSERSCLKMHGTMLAADPGLIYWNSATVSCLHAIRDMRDGGVPVFFTVDAGPQVKAVCLHGYADQVAQCLSGLQGVSETLISGLGAGARVVD